MRQYLFELRRSADMTQREITAYILKKFGIKLRYGDIERGNCWPEISSQRAEILADALGTSTEYILACEKNEGGYVGEGLSGSCENHQLRVGKHLPRNEYNEPLSKAEQEFSGKYYSYACRVIRCLERKEFFRAIERRIIDCDDLTEIGVISFLKSVKYIFSEQLYNNDEQYLKGIISHRIKWGISKHIKSLLDSDKRRANTNSLYIDEKISEDSDDCFYEYISSLAIPVPKAAESSCALSYLFSYLSENQQMICHCLIAGYTRKELTTSHEYSETDIGIVIFYINQIFFHL